MTFFSGVFVHHPHPIRLSILDSLLSTLLCLVLVPLHEDRDQEVLGVTACDLYLSTAFLQSGQPSENRRWLCLYMSGGVGLLQPFCFIALSFVFRSA